MTLNSPEKAMNSLVKAVFLQRTPTSDQQNNNHKIMFNVRLYLRMTLNSPKEAMNSLVEAVSALVMINMTIETLP